jgi:hypothetical protein
MTSVVADYGLGLRGNAYAFEILGGRTPDQVTLRDRRQ